MPGMKLYDGADFQKTQAYNMVLHNASSAPSGGVEGQIYINTTSHVPEYHNGTTFVPFGSGTGTANALTAGDLSPLFTTTEGGSGTATLTLSFTANSSVTNNTVLAGPGSGGAGAYSFRSLVQADIPATIPLSYWAAATADVSHGGFKITNVAAPVSGTDVTNKTYVDNLFQVGTRDYKESVRLASTANVSVTYTATGGTSTRGQITNAPNTLNGTTLVANDRILLKDQTTGAQNGIWVVTTVGTGANGVWDRATDFDADNEVTAGLQVNVTNFTTTDNRGTYLLTTSDPITIGGSSGTALAFVNIQSVGGYVAGNGMSSTGFTFNINAANTSITVGTDDIAVNLTTNGGLEISSGVKIKPDTATTNTIALTLTANGAGVKYDAASFTQTSQVLSLASGVAGAGLVLTSGVLSVANYTVVSGSTVARKVIITQSIATGAFGIALTHNLGTKAVTVAVRDTGNDEYFFPRVVANSTSQVTIYGTNTGASAVAAEITVTG